LLEWNLVKFEAALGRLNHIGKPFKMENVFNMPYDCDFKNDKVDRLATQVATATENLQDSKLMSDSCRAKCAVRRLRNSSLVGCMAKTFARGKDFVNTDTGNHYGHTHKFTSAFMRNCSDSDSRKWDIIEKSDLALVHLQISSFSEWFLHIIRGAEGKGYNKLGTNKTICTHAMQGRHYCEKWEIFLSVKFSFSELHKIYEKQCRKQGELIPLNGMMRSSC
jgi:hypothetical protein